MKNRKILKILAISLPTLLILISSFLLLGRYITYNKPNITEGEHILYIYSNTGYEAVKDSIIKLGCIINQRSFDRAAAKLNLKESFKPGRYILSKGMSNKEVIVKIILNNEDPLNLTIAGSIRTKEKLAQIIDKKIEKRYDEIIDILNNDSIIKSYGFNGNTFISMILPDTYEIYWTTSVTDLLDKLKKYYDKFWNEERLKKAQTMGLTKTEVSTLASIVFEESKSTEEQPIIAGVYLNRLRIGMPLQADPTIVYANGDFSIRRVLHKHLTINSPYNTYKFKGLPPGPISLPPSSVIDAVLNYAHHKYIYFCASPEFNGRHLFAENMAQHQKNALAYRRALNKRNIMK